MTRWVLLVSAFRFFPAPTHDRCLLPFVFAVGSCRGSLSLTFSAGRHRVFHQIRRRERRRHLRGGPQLLPRTPRPYSSLNLVEPACLHVSWICCCASWLHWVSGSWGLHSALCRPVLLPGTLMCESPPAAEFAAFGCDPDRVRPGNVTTSRSADHCAALTQLACLAKGHNHAKGHKTNFPAGAGSGSLKGQPLSAGRMAAETPNMMGYVSAAKTLANGIHAVCRSRSRVFRQSWRFGYSCPLSARSPPSRYGDLPFVFSDLEGKGTRHEEGIARWKFEPVTWMEPPIRAMRRNYRWWLRVLTLKP